jgi:hypothetical protein
LQYYHRAGILALPDVPSGPGQGGAVSTGPLGPAPEGLLSEPTLRRQESMSGIRAGPLGALVALLVCSLLGPTASTTTATLAAPATSDLAAAPPGGPLGAPVLQTCGLSPEEVQMADLMRQYPGQRRSVFNCNAILARVARARAEDMATRNYLSHTTPEGFGANYLVRQAGYVLPAWYPTSNAASNIESIVPGRAPAEVAFTALVEDPPHRSHILGEVPTFAAQTDYGIGYSPNGNIWVILTAQPGP